MDYEVYTNACILFYNIEKSKVKGFVKSNYLENMHKLVFKHVKEEIWELLNVNTQLEVIEEAKFLYQNFERCYEFRIMY